jgi:hypothetical protein
VLLTFKLIDRFEILRRSSPELSPVHKDSRSHEGLLFPPPLFLLSFRRVLGFGIYGRRFISWLLSQGHLSFCEEHELMLSAFDNWHPIHVESAATIDCVALVLRNRANLDTLVPIPFLWRLFHVLVKLGPLGISFPFFGFVPMAALKVLRSSIRGIIFILIKSFQASKPRCRAGTVRNLEFLS